MLCTKIIMPWTNNSYRMKLPTKKDMCEVLSNTSATPMKEKIWKWKTNISNAGQNLFLNPWNLDELVNQQTGAKNWDTKGNFINKRRKELPIKKKKKTREEKSMRKDKLPFRTTRKNIERQNLVSCNSIKLKSLNILILRRKKTKKFSQYVDDLHMKNVNKSCLCISYPTKRRTTTNRGIAFLALGCS